MANVGSNVVVNIEANASEFDIGMHRATKATKNFENQTKKTHGQLRLIRGGFGQVGHQIQDVAVQLQMGQNAMLVFGQQGSQIASLFGPGGAMIGALLAVGAALSMALMPRLFGATQAAKDLKNEMDNLADNFDTLTEAQKKLVRAQVGKTIADNTALLRKQQRELNDLTSITLSFREIFFPKDDEEKADRIQTLKASIQVLKKQNIELKKSIDDTTTEFEKQEVALKKQIDTFGMSARQIKEYNILEQLKRGEIKQTEADKLLAYNAELQRLENLSKAQEDAQKRASDAEEDAQKRASAAQQKAVKEAEKALKEREKTIQKFADSIGDGFVNAISGAMSFKDAMKNVAQSVINDLIRMIVKKQITDQIFGFMTNAMNPGGVIGAGEGDAGFIGPLQPRANGGLVTKGRPYMVGERGRELFVPNQSGNIIPNNRLESGGVTVNQTINITTGVQATVRAEIQNLMPQINESTKAAVAEARQRGGGYSKALLGV